MKFNINHIARYFITRNGDVFKIINVNTNTVQFKGVLGICIHSKEYERDYNMRWFLNGQYSYFDNFDHKNDLIKEVTPKEYPEYFI